MIDEADPIMANQLKDCTMKVFKKKEKFSISEMFSCELKFASDCIKNGLQKNTRKDL